MDNEVNDRQIDDKWTKMNESGQVMNINED